MALYIAKFYQLVTIILFHLSHFSENDDFYYLVTTMKMQYSIVCYYVRQGGNIVGSVFWPVKGKDNPFRKPVSEMTYTVSGGTLNPTQPTKVIFLLFVCFFVC